MQVRRRFAVRSHFTTYRDSGQRGRDTIKPMATQKDALSLSFRSNLRRTCWIVIGVGVLTCFGVFLMPNWYKSEAKLLPVEAKGVGGLGNLASLAGAFGVSLPAGEGSDSSYVDILNSRSLRQEILKTKFRFNIRSLFGTIKNYDLTLSEFLHAKNPDRGVAMLNSYLVVTRDAKSKVITISAETQSPELSEQIVQRANDLLEITLQQKGRTRGGAKVAFAEARLKDARLELEMAEDEFRRFLEVNKNYSTSGEPSIRLKGMRFEAEMRMRQQLLSAIATNREQALLEEKNDIPILNLLDAANYPFEKSKPKRAVIVLMSCIAAGIGSFLFFNRALIKEKFFTEVDE